MLERAAERAVRQVAPVVVGEMFQAMGIDASDPLSMQRHMHYLQESASRSTDPEIIADRVFLRETRLRCERFWSRVYDTFSGALIRWTLSLIRWVIVAAVFGAVIWAGADVGGLDAFLKAILALLS